MKKEEQDIMPEEENKHIDYFEIFRKKYKKNILSEKDFIIDFQKNFIVLENNTKYNVSIMKHDYGFYERWNIYTEDNADSSIIKHRLLKPSCFKYNKKGKLFKYDTLKKYNPEGVYYLHNIEYSKQDFFNQPENRALILKKRLE